MKFYDRENEIAFLKDKPWRNENSPRRQAEAVG